MRIINQDSVTSILVDITPSKLTKVYNLFKVNLLAISLKT